MEINSFKKLCSHVPDFVFPFDVPMFPTSCSHSMFPCSRLRVPTRCSHVPDFVFPLDVPMFLTSCSHSMFPCSHSVFPKKPKMFPIRWRQDAMFPLFPLFPRKNRTLQERKKKRHREREREKKNALKAIYIKKSENIGNTLCFLSIKPFITPFSLLFRVPTHWEHTGNILGTQWRNGAMFPCSHSRVPPFRRFRCINFTESTSGNTSILGVKNSKFLVIVNFR